MLRLNSKLIRKPPPPIIEEPQFSDDLDFKKFDIDSYLSKSPIISSFRQQNPNLQPTSDDSDFDMYSSLDPSIKSVPPSPAISQASFITANDFSPMMNSPFPSIGNGQSNGNGHSNGNGVNGSANGYSPGNGSLTEKHEGLGIYDGKFSTTAPLEPIVVDLPNRKFKDRFKRLSLNNYGTKKFIPSHKKYPSEGGKRLSMLLPNRQRSDSYQSITSDGGDEDVVNTPYWKYHILRFGKDLYLTTNPSLKHMYCRNGPGYYVEITSGKTADDGFTMVFKDSTNQSDKSIPPIMIIHKKSVKEGGHLTISLTKQNQLKKNIIKNDKKSDKTKIFNGLSIPQTIPEQFIPYDKISNNKFFERNEINFQNYELRDFNNVKWNIGSIPRVRFSRMNKFKTNLDNKSMKNSSSSYSLQSITSIQSNQSFQSEEPFKFIGQKNIYFHQNYLDSNTPLPYKSNNPEDTYLQTDETSFPPVLGLFRPYEKKLTKKFVNSINKRLSRSFDKDLSIVDLNNFNKFKNNLVNNDLAGGSIKNYFIAGDGLYYNQNPLDDLPDDNKLGWLTIYEDKMLQDKGMFDLVLGILTAVGYESYMKGIK